MVKKLIPVTEEQWIEARKQGIGSSEAGTYLELNFHITKTGEKKYWETPLSSWQKKTGRAPMPETNDAMVRGHLAEDFVANYFAYKTNSEIIKASAGNIIYYDDQHPWRRVTPDRFCWIPGRNRDRKRIDNKFILECKTYNGYITDGNYPQYWYVQVMYQLGVCGCPYGYIAWVDSHLNVDFERIDFDKPTFDAICSVIDHVWNYNILQDVPPSPIDASDITIVYPHHEEGKSVEFDNEMANLVDQYNQLMADIKEKTEQADAIKDRIVVAMADAEVAKDLSGIPLCTYKSRSEFNEDALREADPSTYAQYCRSVSKFDKAAYKKAVGTKEYTKYTQLSNTRTLRFS